MLRNKITRKLKDLYVNEFKIYLENNGFKYVFDEWCSGFGFDIVDHVASSESFCEFKYADVNDKDILNHYGELKLANKEYEYEQNIRNKQR